MAKPTVYPAGAYIGHQGDTMVFKQPKVLLSQNVYDNLMQIADSKQTKWMKENVIVNDAVPSVTMQSGDTFTVNHTSTLSWDEDKEPDALWDLI